MLRMSAFFMSSCCAATVACLCRNGKRFLASAKVLCRPLRAVQVACFGGKFMISWECTGCYFIYISMNSNRRFSALYIWHDRVK